MPADKCAAARLASAGAHPAQMASSYADRGNLGRVFLLLLLRRVDPAAVVLDQLHQRVGCAHHRDAALHHLLAHIQINLAGRAAHVAKISVRHLSGAVNNAAHDRNRNAGQVARLGADLLRDVLQVKERAATRGARDVLRLGVAHA
eukprot:237733-Chlamydomonas_euryale.AAC.2